MKAPVFGDIPVETCDGERIDVSDYRNYTLRVAKGRFGGMVFFKEARSVLKSGKGKKQASMWFNFTTGETDRMNSHRYITIRNVEDLSEMVFDV